MAGGSGGCDSAAAAAAATDGAEEEVVLRVGLIADVQHADLNDARSDYGAIRSYRDGPVKARLAAEDWLGSGCALAVNLGDTVDRRGGADAPAALQRVLAAFRPFGPLLHLPGNHDLSALPAAQVASLDPRLGSKGLLECVAGDGCYCDVQVGPGWRAILLDTYELAVRRAEAPALALRERLICEARLRGEVPGAYLAQHAELNGGVGPAQLAWLRGRLEAAEAARQRVVVLAHAALLSEATIYGDAACWNGREVSDVLDNFPHVVAAVITGHDHHFGEARSDAGIYHRVLEASFEGEAGVPTHAILELRGPTLCLVGRGAVRPWRQTSPPWPAPR